MVVFYTLYKIQCNKVFVVFRLTVIAYCIAFRTQRRCHTLKLQPNVTEPDLPVDASAIKRYITVLCHFNALLSVNRKDYYTHFHNFACKGFISEVPLLRCYFFSNYFNFVVICFSLFC